MPTYAETTKDVQDKVLDHIHVSQQAVVDCVRSWAETVEMMFSRLPELNSDDAPLRPGRIFESAFWFTERVMASQREFAAQVFEAAWPPLTRTAQVATDKAATAARAATDKAAKAASDKA